MRKQRPNRVAIRWRIISRGDRREIVAGSCALIDPQVEESLPHKEAALMDWSAFNGYARIGVCICAGVVNKLHTTSLKNCVTAAQQTNMINFIR